MADDQIVIDKALFHERLNSLVTKWKADKRSGDQVFQGAGSIVTLVGKQSDDGIYHKPAAFQVGRRISSSGKAQADNTTAMAAGL
jgi:nucleosome binding factor SPN SPT16 subunit